MQQESIEVERLDNTTKVKIQRQVEQLTASDEDLTEESRFSSKQSNEQQQQQQQQQQQREHESSTTEPAVTNFVPLRMGGRGGTHLVSKGSARLIQDEVSLADLERMTTLFYDKFRHLDADEKKKNKNGLLAIYSYLDKTHTERVKE